MATYTRQCSFVDRDILMRYHWGLTVGHQYGHGTAQATKLGSTRATAPDELDDDGGSCHTGDQAESCTSDHGDAGEPELSSDLGSEAHKDSEDDMCKELAMDDMYGDSCHFKCYD